MSFSAPAFPPGMKSRAQSLRSIQENLFDVCVIGGGATGAGCALDSQLRGFRTVLVDAADFASGTSSASTKMVHGGVRYLEEAIRHLDAAEYRVVRRALREREHVLRNGSFLTRTRQFVTPCYSRREVAYYGIGLQLYDWIAGSAGLAPSRLLSRAEALQRIPGLNGTGLAGAVAYADGQLDDARYNMALVVTFADAGGEALNYARVREFQKDGNGKIAEAEIEDRVLGKSFRVRARAFVNATGPSADRIRQMANPGVERRMRLSRGVHILLPLDILAGPVASEHEDSGTGDRDHNRPVSDALLIPKTEDGRVLFAIPWMDRLLVGTTDDEVETVETPGVSKPEVEYLLRHLNRYLARAVDADQIVGAFAGVRPLVTPGRGRQKAERGTKGLARDHEVEVDRKSGLISIMGGKWTTYRAMAEDTIDAVERSIGRGGSPCKTLEYPLAGSASFIAEYWQTLARGFGIAEESARHLAAKFGTRAADVMALAKENPSFAAPLANGRAALRAEVVFCARHEMAMSIEDVLARRIGLEFYGWRESLEAAPSVAELLAEELGWTAEEKERAVSDYVTRIENFRREAGLDQGTGPSGA